jgi:hypothetical protein
MFILTGDGIWFFYSYDPDGKWSTDPDGNIVAPMLTVADDKVMAAIM